MPAEQFIEKLNFTVLAVHICVYFAIYIAAIYLYTCMVVTLQTNYIIMCIYFACVEQGIVDYSCNSIKKQLYRLKVFLER